MTNLISEQTRTIAGSGTNDLLWQVLSRQVVAAETAPNRCRLKSLRMKSMIGVHWGYDRKEKKRLHLSLFQPAVTTISSTDACPVNSVNGIGRVQKRSRLDGVFQGSKP